MDHILFTHSYFLQLDTKQQEWNKPYPPLGTILAASFLRQNGYEVSLFDTMFVTDPLKINSHLDQSRPKVVVIYDDGFNYLTKMCLTNMREAAWLMAKEAQKRGCKVIACSSDSTDHYEAYLKEGVDFVILGEGEQTLLELVNALNEGQGVDNIPGLAFTQDENLKKTPPRPVMRDLDQLPLPAWDLIDIDPYRQRWVNNWGYFSINIATTRGCPYKCNWCAKPIYGNSYKMRSPEHVVKEIELVKKLFHFDHIWFCDDIFGLKRSWVIQFADLVKERGLSFKYKIQSRADLLVKGQYVEALAASGCEEAWMGVESGSQEILDAMDKGITIEQVKAARALLAKHQIRACFFIQFGYLNETAEDIRKTIDLINELLPNDIGVSVSYPLPGTGFYEMVKKNLSGKTNWTDSDDLDLMFENTYPRGFYKKLHRYVHSNFRMHLARKQIRDLMKRPTSGKRSIKKALSYFYYAPSTILRRVYLKSIYHDAAARL